MMLSEGEYIVETFKKAFAKDRSVRICLYGTGRFTKLLLEELKDFNIVGVADFSCNRDIWESYRIISKSDIWREVDFLVLITNPANIRVVYKKVKEIAEQVKIYTIEKKMLGKNSNIGKELQCKKHCKILSNMLYL